MLRPHADALGMLHRFLEGTLVAGTYVVLCEHLNHDTKPYIVWAGIVAALVYLVIGELYQLYNSWRLSSLDQEFRNVLLAWAATCVSVVVLAFLFKVSANYSRVATIAWFLMAPALLLGLRLSV